MLGVNRLVKVACAATLLVAVILMGYLPALARPREAKGVLAAYLKVMGSHDDEAVLSLVDEFGPGQDPAPPVDVVSMGLEEAEASGLLRLASDPETIRRCWLAVICRQRDLVEAQFGPDSWTNATFTLGRVPCPETQETWVDEQNRVVRPEVAQRLLEDFWSEVASRDAAPAKLVLRDSYETYLARLGFGPESSDQCHEFKVYVAYRDGVWKVSSLSWHSPEIPCQGDI